MFEGHVKIGSVDLDFWIFDIMLKSPIRSLLNIGSGSVLSGLSLDRIVTNV